MQSLLSLRLALSRHQRNLSSAVLKLGEIERLRPCEATLAEHICRRIGTSSVVKHGLAIFSGVAGHLIHVLCVRDGAMSCSVLQIGATACVFVALISNS